MRREDLLRVRSHVRTLMDSSAFPGAQRDAALALLKDLSKCVGIDENDLMSKDCQESYLPSGTAISPKDAARCLPDYVRTGRFLRGVSGAIKAARRKFPDETVRVLYAGCGPFAILVLPIAHHWRPDEVRFTLLDYHARSLHAARQVAGELGVLDRIDDFVRADAAVYRCPTDARPHVLVTETMQRALDKEPQVSITTNLARQLAPGGLLVPEQIELHLTLMNPAKEFGLNSPTCQRDRREIGCVMMLNQTGEHYYDVTWPDLPMDNRQAFIRTFIRVFDNISIGDYESGLTGIKPLFGSQHTEENRQPRPGVLVHFAYQLQPIPQLVYTLSV